MIDDDTQELFRAELDGLIESLEATLLALRDAPEDREIIDAVFRDLHTIKGTCGMFGETAIAAFMHDFETTFEAVRNGAIAVSPALIDLCLRARDVTAEMADGQSPETSGLLSALSRLVSADGTKTASDVAPPPATDSEASQTGGDQAPPPWDIRFRLPPDTLSLGGRPELVLDELAELGARISVDLADMPRLTQLDPAVLSMTWHGVVPGSVSEDAIRGVFLFHDHGLDLQLDRRAAQDPSDGGAATPPPTDAPRDTQMATTRPAARGEGLMRVPAARLDDLMDRVGELVIAEARLAQLAAQLGDPQLISVAEDIQRLSTGMRDTTMSIRMTPMGALVGRFRRLVHDLQGELGKPIDFVVTGEKTELDKTVIEQLADPLMHLLRNSIDHGIEDPAARRASGKPEGGRIELSARYSGAEVLICLSDDGGGLDTDRIRKRAVERGLITDTHGMTDADIHQLVFEPGFSTAKAVTELSGRGVGMDVVRRTIEGLRGSVEIASTRGAGTTVSLRLPLTLAIVDGMLVEVGGERYSIPLAAVEHIVELPRDRGDGARTRLLELRDQLVPYLFLREIFECAGTPPQHQMVVVVTSGDLRVGLVVDSIVGTSQTVIKQLSPLHMHLKEFSGATILGDGSAALILDIPHLVATAQSDLEREVA